MNKPKNDVFEPSWNVENQNKQNTIVKGYAMYAEMEGDTSGVDLGSLTNVKSYKQWNICFEDILMLKIDMVAIESVNP